MSKDDKVYYGLCYVVNDKPEDSYEIDVMLVSIMPDVKGTLNADDDSSVTTQDSKGNYTSTAVTSSNNITATWLPDGEQNRLSAPDVCKGDIVEVYTVNDTDEYYWKVYAHNASLRKREKVLYWFSNKAGNGGSDIEANGYYLLIDTRNKVLHLHTANNDGEATSYDIMLDTGNGILTVKDTSGNDIQLDSVAGDLTATIVNSVTINTKKVEFNCEDFTVNASNSHTVKTNLHTVNSKKSSTN